MEGLRAFDDLESAARRTNRRAVGASLAIGLLIAANVLADISNRIAGVASLILILGSFAASAVVFFLVQRSPNDYIAARYPDAKPSGLTWGEITASVIGILLLALIILATLAGG